MSLSILGHEAWEPVFARNTQRLWRLDYSGFGDWVIYQRRTWNGITKWVDIFAGDVNELSRWARKTRKNDPTFVGPFNVRYGDIDLIRQFGIRVTGSYVTRLQKLRESLFMIGWAEQFTTEGYIGTSFVMKSELTAYAELGNLGGIDVWVRKTKRFSCEDEIVCCKSDCSSIQEIEESLDEVGMSLFKVVEEKLCGLFDI